MKLHKCRYCGGMSYNNDENCLEKPPHIKSDKWLPKKLTLNEQLFTAI